MGVCFEGRPKTTTSRDAQTLTQTRLWTLVGVMMDFYTPMENVRMLGLQTCFPHFGCGQTKSPTGRTMAMIHRFAQLNLRICLPFNRVPLLGQGWMSPQRSDLTSLPDSASLFDVLLLWPSFMAPFLSITCTFWRRIRPQKAHYDSGKRGFSKIASPGPQSKTRNLFNGCASHQPPRGSFSRRHSI